MASSSLSWIGWMFLPNLATSTLQSLYYRITIRAGSPHPNPSSPQFALHHRRIRIFVISSYLAYTLYEAYYNLLMTPTFYEALGLDQDVDERGIKSKFRRLAAQHHPDKNVGAGSTGDDAYFNYLKTAQDTLLDPAKRWAYERFGPDILSWTHCKSIKDYFHAGLTATGPYYVLGALFMVILSWLGYIHWGKFWRFYTLPLLLTLELYLVTSPTILQLPLLPPGPLKLPHNHDPLLPFQLISLARTLSITLSIAISQLSPPQSPDNNSATGASPQTLQYLDRLLVMSKLADAEATRLLSLSLSPFRGDGEGARDLRGRMKEWVVLGRIRGSKGVREVVEGGGNRRREESERDVRERVVALEDSEGED